MRYLAELGPGSGTRYSVLELSSPRPYGSRSVVLVCGLKPSVWYITRINPLAESADIVGR